MTTFGRFTVDSDTRELRRDGRAVHLSPKAFELLVALLDVRPRVLSKADLQERLWPHTFVAEANLSNLVAEVRKAIGDTSRAPRFLRTAHGFGYAFCGDATTEPAPLLAVPPAPVCWLVWGEQEFPLSEGEHIIGREVGADLQFDATTISRKHARVIVRDGCVCLEDLGSKNGTFRAADRVTSPVSLFHGDVVRIGALTLTLRLRRPFAPTETAI